MYYDYMGYSLVVITKNIYMVLLQIGVDNNLSR